MFIISSVIHISLLVYTLLARGANLKIQAVLNKRWQTFRLLIFLSCKTNAFFRTPEKTRNVKYTRFSHSHVPFVVRFICVREGGVTYYQVIAQKLSFHTKWWYHKRLRSERLHCTAKKIFVLQFLLVFIRS